MNAQTLIATLKGIDTNRAHLDELLVLSMQAKALRTEYEQREMDVPEWLTDAVEKLNAEVQLRNRDNLMARLRQAEQAEQALKTTAEKRADAQAEKARLRRKLGLPVDEPAAAGATQS